MNFYYLICKFVVVVFYYDELYNICGVWGYKICVECNDFLGCEVELFWFIVKVIIGDIVVCIICVRWWDGNRW